MTIEILETKTIETEGYTSRHTLIVIKDNGNSYLWNVGGLPVEGDLQTILNAREAELLAAAIAAGVMANAPEVAISQTPGAVRTWFAANPNAKLIWSMTVTDLVAEIAALVDISFPAPATAATRTKWKLLLTAITLVIRILVKREKLDT